MFNPEKQARAPGGKFGGKVVAEVEVVAEKVVHEVEVVATAGYKTINEALNSPGNSPGVMVAATPFDYPEHGLKYWQIMLIGIICLAAVYLIFG